MDVIDQVVKVLSDGYWHGVTELGGKVALTEEKLGKVLAFLKDYGFIHLSEGSAKLTDKTLKWMRELKEPEN